MLEEPSETLYTTNKYEYKNLSDFNRRLCPSIKHPYLRYKDGNFVCANKTTSIHNTNNKQQILQYYNNTNKKYNTPIMLGTVITTPAIIIDKPISFQYGLPNELDNYVMTTPEIFDNCGTTLLIPKFIIINGRQYDKQKLLGCGSWSQVYEYMNDEFKKYYMKIIKI